MPSILELFEKSKPKSAVANTKGTDRTPIGNDDPNGEFSPSTNLMLNETRLKIARKGEVPTDKAYGKTDRNK